MSASPNIPGTDATLPAPLFLWHGEQDRIMPVVPARLLAQALPQCRLTFYPDTGHLSTVVKHARDIMQSLSD